MVVPYWCESGVLYFFSFNLGLKQLYSRIKLSTKVLSMPVEMALHLLDETFALECLADQRSGLFSLGVCVGEACDYLCDGVTVDNDCVEAKGLEPGLVDFSMMGIHGFLGLAKGVDINKDGEVVEFIIAGKSSGFPNAALRYFSVSSDAVDVVVDVVEVLARVGHTRSN